MSKQPSEKKIQSTGRAGWTAGTLARELGVAVELVLELSAGCTYFDQAKRESLRLAIDARMQGEKNPPDGSAPSPASEPAVETEDLILTRVFGWGAKVLADRPNGLEVAVELKSARFLKPGMLLKGCVKGELGWYYYGRLPRVLGEAQLFMPDPVEVKS